MLFLSCSVVGAAAGFSRSAIGSCARAGAGPVTAKYRMCVGTRCNGDLAAGFDRYISKNLVVHGFNGPENRED
ncbi:hypothetical protein ACWGLG_10805 [Streptomyces antimycoticus]|nr:hypothetical protein [Streptomyces antimycoticus]